jgi:hypothetical protein
MPAKAKKTKPVTSSHSCPSTRPQWVAVARPAFVTAPNVRERPARWDMTLPATRAAMPSFRVVETPAILMILSIFGRRGFAKHVSGVQYRGE